MLSKMTFLSTRETVTKNRNKSKLPNPSPCIVFRNSVVHCVSVMTVHQLYRISPYFSYRSSRVLTFLSDYIVSLAQTFRKRSIFNVQF